MPSPNSTACHAFAPSSTRTGAACCAPAGVSGTSHTSAAPTASVAHSATLTSPRGSTFTQSTSVRLCTSGVGPFMSSPAGPSCSASTRVPVGLTPVASATKPCAVPATAATPSSLGAAASARGGAIGAPFGSSTVENQRAPSGCARAAQRASVLPRAEVPTYGPKVPSGTRSTSLPSRAGATSSTRGSGGAGGAGGSGVATIGSAGTALGADAVQLGKAAQASRAASTPTRSKEAPLVRASAL
jgi:hypothetical protein